MRYLSVYSPLYSGVSALIIGALLFIGVVLTVLLDLALGVSYQFPIPQITVSPPYQFPHFQHKVHPLGEIEVVSHGMRKKVLMLITETPCAK